MTINKRRVSGRTSVRRILLTLVAGTALLAGPMGQVPAAADHLTCGGSTTKVNNIHWGTINGTATIKVVGQLKCTGTVDSISTWAVQLSHCGSQVPQLDETWISTHCTSYAHVKDPFKASAGVTYNWSAPRPADVPVTATGYYIACMSFTAQDSHGGITQEKWYGYYYSAIAYCTATTCT